MYCQSCGAFNTEEQEFCSRCHQKLLVLSGGVSDHFDESAEESFSLDEHLLERISILEEAVKRTADTVRQLLEATHKQERNLLINQTGLATLRELLEQKKVLVQEEWAELWKTKMDYQLLALEKRERFGALKDRIAALFRGRKRPLFMSLLRDAEYALFAFDVERAMRALESAFKLDRENYDLAYFLGETYFNEGITDTALAYFARVLAVKPDHYEGLVYSGVIHHERGDGDRAEDYLKRAVALYPDSFLPHFSLGAVYAGRSQLAKAVAFLRRAVELDSVPQALYLLGNCLYEMGRCSAAIRHLKEVVRLDPAFEEAYHLLGLAYLDRKWHRKALDAFRQAQTLNPKSMRYQDLVRYLSGQASSPLPQVKGEARDWFQRAERFLSEDKPDRALAAYRKAIIIDPENPTLLLSCAMTCLTLNRSNETELMTRRVLELEPGEMLKATAYATLIEALRSEGKYREGNRIGETLLVEGSSNFAKTIAYYEMAYNMAEMEEDLDRALDYARRSLECAPEELRQFPLAALGWVHYKRREFEEAVEFLSRSSELGPSSTTLTHLGMALLASGDETKAKDVLAHARQLQGRGGSVEQKMMECMKDSTRLLEQVRQRQKK